MKIDVSQKSGVGISIHDDELSELRFIREKKELRLSMLAWETAEVVPSEFKMKSPCYEIVFHQVRGFEMTSCDFCGQSQRALGLTLMDEKGRTLLPWLLQQRDARDRYKESVLGAEEDYLECMIEFISGDFFTVVCQAIEVPDEKVYWAK